MGRDLYFPPISYSTKPHPTWLRSILSQIHLEASSTRTSTSPGSSEVLYYKITCTPKLESSRGHSEGSAALSPRPLQTEVAHFAVSELTSVLDSHRIIYDHSYIKSVKTSPHFPPICPRLRAFWQKYCSAFTSIRGKWKNKSQWTQAGRREIPMSYWEIFFSQWALSNTGTEVWKSCETPSLKIFKTQPENVWATWSKSVLPGSEVEPEISTSSFQSKMILWFY